MGRFKNKKTVIKDIGVDDKGMPTIKRLSILEQLHQRNPNSRDFHSGEDLERKIDLTE